MRQPPDTGEQIRRGNAFLIQIVAQYSLTPRRPRLVRPRRNSTQNGSASLDPIVCQRRSNFPQNCRSKNPQFCRSRPGVGVTIFGWPPTWPRDRRGRWRCDNRFGTDVLGHELGVLAQSVTGALDLHDHGMVEQAVQ